MSAIETAPAGREPGDPQTSRPTATEVTGWLLEGRWFTIDMEGRVGSWSPAAKDRFGYRRKDISGSPFIDTLVAPGGQAAAAEAVGAALGGTATQHAGFTGELDALTAGGESLRAAFALVPIQLSVGYEFNDLLSEISGRAGSSEPIGALKAKHESVLTLIESALSGKAAEAAQTEDGGRLAGALVVFRTGAASPTPSAPPPPPDNVVSIADAAGIDEARAQLERSRKELEEARVEVRNLQGQLEEARRESQRSRNEADVARQEAGDARDALALAQRETEESQRHAEEVRRQVDDARAAAESSRIRSEDVQREADNLRAELRDARDAARGAMGQADDELQSTRADLDRARAELADARAEAGRHSAEVEALRERLQDTQRELGTLRAELETARGELAQGSALSERRGSEAERLRAELEEKRAESERLSAEFNRQASASAEAVAQLERVQKELEAARAQGVPAGVPVDDERISEARQAAERAEREAADARADSARHTAEVEGLRERLQETQRELGQLRAEVEAGRAELAQANTLSERRGQEVERLRGELNAAHTAAANMAEAVDGVIVDDELPGDELVPAGDGPSADALRRALDEDRFQLHGQPVLNLRTNEVSQYELLIRMVGEDGRLVLPQAFLGPARRAGLAHAIDRWVVRRAIALLARTDDNVSLEVNLLPEAIHDADLPAVIDEELASTPIDPARLVLEVTGATAAADIDATRTLAKRIRGLGCRFALDDFRSTFGALRLLKDLPLDYLKLDGELVGSLAESRTSQLIVKALVEVATGTGAKTVAVFVSDEDTLALLRQQGVDYAQGYRVGRPKPVSEIWGQAALPPGEG